MSNNYTVADLRRQIELLTADITPAVRERWGMPEDFQLEMDHGSQTYGRAWRLWFVSDSSGNSGHHTINSRVSSASYLGWTKNEAWTTLLMLRREAMLIESLSQ